MPTKTPRGRAVRAPGGPLRPPELPARWKSGFVSESTVSYIPSAARNLATFSLVSYLDRDFLVQLSVSPEVSFQGFPVQQYFSYTVP